MKSCIKRNVLINNAITIIFEQLLSTTIMDIFCEKFNGFAIKKVSNCSFSVYQLQSFCLAVRNSTVIPKISSSLMIPGRVHAVSEGKLYSLVPNVLYRILSLWLSFIKKKRQSILVLYSLQLLTV